MNELNVNIKNSVHIFCKNMFEIIKNNHPDIRGIVVQLNHDKIYIGCNVNGSFRPIYFNPNETTNDINNAGLANYIHNNGKCIYDCKNEIDNTNLNRKLRSFNIFYKCNKKGVNSINICENKIGNVSIARCRLFNEFSL